MACGGTTPAAEEPVTQPVTEPAEETAPPVEAEPVEAEPEPEIADEDGESAEAPDSFEPPEEAGGPTIQPLYGRPASPRK